jgi:hypothetical protein
MADQLKSRNLVPFKKPRGRYNIPGLTSEQDALIDRIAPDLSSEEQGFIRHYLGYADIFLRNVEESESASQKRVFPPSESPAESVRPDQKDPTDKAA